MDKHVNVNPNPPTINSSTKLFLKATVYNNAVTNKGIITINPFLMKQIESH